ncbi:hypothetical protein NMG60_11003001 [Bertholletia excelsa]
MAKMRRIATFVLRLLALGATTAAAAVMVTSEETAYMYTMSYEAKYTNMPAFVYFVITNVIGALYTLAVLFIPLNHVLGRFIAGLDVIMAVLLTSGASAAVAVAYVGEKGNSHAGWWPICNQVKHYCVEVAGALAAAFAGAAIYLLLVLYNIYTLFSKVDDY